LPPLRNLYLTRLNGLTEILEAKRQIKRLVENDLCRGNVKPGYVLGQLDDDQYDYLCLGFTESPNITFQGFITAYDDENGVYLDVVCANQGYGGPIIKGFSEFVRSQRLGNLTLSSLINVIGVYLKSGFNFRKSCSEPPFVLSERFPELWEAYSAITKFIPTTQKAYDNDVMLTTMKVLTLNGFMSSKNALQCMNMSIAAGPLDKYRNFVKRYGCASDGFTMIQCIDASYPSTDVILTGASGLPAQIVALKKLNYDAKMLTQQVMTGLQGREGPVTRSRRLADVTQAAATVLAKKKNKNERERVNVMTGKPFTRSSGLVASLPTTRAASRRLSGRSS
jgi:hypothetical protein